MKIAVNSLLSLLDVGTGFCYWLLGRDLLEDEVKRIQNLFVNIQKPDDEYILIDELRSLSPGKDLLLVCDRHDHNLIQWCILNNYVQALIVLLEYGCNPTRTGQPDRDLPLALACSLGQIEVIQLLLDYGANPSQTTFLSPEALETLAEKTTKEHYLKLIDLLKYKPNVSSLNIILTFDDLSIFRLLMGETIQTSSISESSSSSVLSPSVNETPMMNDHSKKSSEDECDLFREKLKFDHYAEEIIAHHQSSDDGLEKPPIAQQNLISSDDLSDYAEQGAFFSFCDTADAESAVVNHDDGAQTLSEKGNHVDRMHEEETCVLGATTDGGYCTVDGSSERIKALVHQPPADAIHLPDMHPEKTKTNLCSIDTGVNHHSDAQRTECLSRSKSQYQLTKLSNSSQTKHRNSLPNNVYDNALDQPSKRYRSTSSFLLSNMGNSSKRTAHLLRLLHQMIEYEAATILEYFLNRHREEFNTHFHSAARSSDIQLKTYELLANIKSDRIYNVLSSSNCAYFNTVTTSLCDRENNTLVHSLLSQNPLKYQPTEMIKMLERYMSCGLNEFINRPNLSNHCMIQILLCNEHFLKMVFFHPLSHWSSSKSTASHQEGSMSYSDSESVEKWRRSYMILIEILIKYGARIDMPAGSYRNSIDGLLSSLIDLHRRLTVSKMVFDIKYLKCLMATLIASLKSTHMTKNRSIYFKYNIERFIQLICMIHVQNDDLFDILTIFHLLLSYECQPLKLNTTTLLHLFKLWITNPNFLCSNLTDKDSLMRKLLAIIIPRLSFLTHQTHFIPETPLILTTTNSMPRKSSLTAHDNELSLQNLFLILLNLITYSQTCIQIQSIYQLILILINHAPIDIINHDLSQLPIVYLCLQVKVIHAKLLFPFIDLFTMIHTSAMIRRTKEILSQASMKRSSTDLYKYFLSIEKTKTPVRSLRYVSSKYLYHQLQKPFAESVMRLPIGDALKERLIHFHDV